MCVSCPLYLFFPVSLYVCIVFVCCCNRRWRHQAVIGDRPISQSDPFQMTGDRRCALLKRRCRQSTRFIDFSRSAPWNLMESRTIPTGWNEATHPALPNIPQSPPHTPFLFPSLYPKTYKWISWKLLRTPVNKKKRNKTFRSQYFDWIPQPNPLPPFLLPLPTPASRTDPPPLPLSPPEEKGLWKIRINWLLLDKERSKEREWVRVRDRETERQRVAPHPQSSNINPNTMRKEAKARQQRNSFITTGRKWVHGADLTHRKKRATIWLNWFDEYTHTHTHTHTHSHTH